VLRLEEEAVVMEGGDEEEEVVEGEEEDPLDVDVVVDVDMAWRTKRAPNAPIKMLIRNKRVYKEKQLNQPFHPP
jgi:hypothetical protein